ASVRTFLLLSLLGAGAALASTAVRLDTAALVAASSDVVDGNVVSSTSVWTGDHRRIVTQVVVEVRDTWKGTAAGRITVVQPGGERDGIGQRVSGVAPLSSGERVVLFLERTGPYHRVVGLAQGVYRVVPVEGSTELRAVPASLEGLELVSPSGGEPAARTPMPLSAFRSSVQAAR
ncbi:MAG TPA: hypothetical protein VGK85_03445, partial [Myxococcaceae bacterium]